MDDRSKISHSFPLPCVVTCDVTDASLPDVCRWLLSKDYYFDSYSHFGIHEEMLKDEVRRPSIPYWYPVCEHLVNIT